MGITATGTGKTVQLIFFYLIRFLAVLILGKITWFRGILIREHSLIG
jgi:hypothetical protein